MNEEGHGSDQSQISQQRGPQSDGECHEIDENDRVASAHTEVNEPVRKMLVVTDMDGQPGLPAQIYDTNRVKNRNAEDKDWREQTPPARIIAHVKRADDRQ